MTHTIFDEFNSFLHESLNESQKKAVTHDSGSLLVVAGAGSGKTRVITARIAHLILNKKVLPSEIVALTFTNKAAKEMQERIIHFLGGKTTHLPFIGTFHAYCVYLLKKNAAYLNTPFFSIMDEEDQKKIINGILVRNNIHKKTTAQNILYRISGIKNQLTRPEDAYAHYAHDPLFARIYQAYEQERIASKCFDFDDLLLEGLRLFNHGAFRTSFHRTVRHVLIDEYQDTNVVQHELLKRMAKDQNEFMLDSICVVGDEDQSIYSWRGATVANIVHFKKDFPQTTLITIEQNYRSVQPILHVANEVIQHNKIRNPKKLWSQRAATNRVYVINCLSEYHEGDMLTQFLSMVIRKNPAQSSAVLYRAHFQSRAIEEALIKQSIPYKIIGGIQFYERKEIKDLLAYLRLIVNPFDRPSFFRIINCPPRGLGDKFEELFHERWRQEPFFTFSELAQKCIEDGTVAKTKASHLIDFITIFSTINHQERPSVILDQIITKTGYMSHLKKMYEAQELQERTENIRELVNAMQYFESQGTHTLSGFLHEVSLMSDMQKHQDADTNPVFMMTLHAAKGLEFDTVIIPGLEDGLLPSARSLLDNEKLEEERRLFYVGMTRARERLLMSRCRYRYTYGQMTDQRVSRFIDELPAQFVMAQDLSHAREAEARTFFAQLLGTSASSIKNSYDDTPVMTFGASIAAQHATDELSDTESFSFDQDPFEELQIPANTAAKSNTLKQKISAPKLNSISSESPWKKNQPVKHATFGVGIVQEVQERNDTSYIVSVKFKEGVKKINSQFLQKI